MSRNKILRKFLIPELCIFFAPLLAFSQNPTKENIILYTFKPPTLLDYFDKENIQTAKLLTSTAIDPKGQGIIDTFDIKRYLTLFYPDSLSKGICVINIEDSVFYNLRLDSSIPQFREAEKRFILILKIVKKIRPNVSFGIYGIPFGVYYPEQTKYNQGGKFDKLFGYCDFIAPSFYINYSDQQIGHVRNINYLQTNLQIALNYSGRLNRPVIPFIWELIHPSNKEFGGTIIPKDEYLDFANFLINYVYKGISIKGLFLWNPGVPSPVYYNQSFRKQTRRMNEKPINAIPDDNAIRNRDSLIIDYYNGILKILGSYK